MNNIWDGIHLKMKRVRMVTTNSKLEYRERIRDDVYPQAIRFMFDPVSKSIRKIYHEKH
jgi:hypothetical protein